MKNQFSKISLLALFIFFVACKHAPTKVLSADGVIAKDTMVAIFTDMHLADAAVQVDGLTNDSMQKTYRLYYQQIFNRYKINTQQFNYSLKYYTQHPEEMDAVYLKVIEELGKKN